MLIVGEPAPTEYMAMIGSLPLRQSVWTPFSVAKAGPSWHSKTVNGGLTVAAGRLEEVIGVKQFGLSLIDFVKSSMLQVLLFISHETERRMIKMKKLYQLGKSMKKNFCR